ncbi:MAG: hypothetical protein NTW87_09895, partial [Planctomycetota bacterium]|nr:hypothetical protein [Planctomycetota bacterium]
MAGASDIKAGGAYIEISAKTDAFEQALSNVDNRMKGFSGSMASAGAVAGVTGAICMKAVEAIGDAVQGAMTRIVDGVSQASDRAKGMERLASRLGTSAGA